MANLPLILVAIGVAIAIVGAFLVAISSQSGPLEKKRRPESRRPHQEIRDLLEHDNNKIPAPTVVLVAGLLCRLVGILWRSMREIR